MEVTPADSSLQQSLWKVVSSLMEPSDGLEMLLMLASSSSLPVTQRHARFKDSF